MLSQVVAEYENHKKKNAQPAEFVKSIKKYNHSSSVWSSSAMELGWFNLYCGYRNEHIQYSFRNKR